MLLMHICITYQNVPSNDYQERSANDGHSNYRDNTTIKHIVCILANTEVIAINGDTITTTLPDDNKRNDR